ncbi:VWA domain-containing protein [Allorhodopirellula heiligendammensis]|uniref:von Willebrand factor type A domain protein n=1 Tax=Allorhodopirellula heiligendammensis TaxID=2714739 RepID=A0A5C6BSZ1_9BACT|nr:VWA domain-containing protein [Allorhodopirellula heiligendammensis]TWU15168.1 von Willebrand factor type A domain protein [Allorhodopirellula heiligendammensis]
MIWKWTALVLCLLTFVEGGRPLGAADSAAENMKTATTSAQKRMIRILTGRSEPAKLKLISQLNAQRSQLNANLGAVIDATEQLLDEYAGSVSDDETLRGNGGEAGVPVSLRQLLQILGNCPHEEAHAVVVDALDHPDTYVSMIAMDTIGEMQHVVAIEDIVRQIRRPAFEEQYAFRFALVRALARLHCPLSIEWLQRLAEQIDGQLRHEIETRLADVDLRDFDGDRERYQGYLEQLEEGAKMAELGMPPRSMTPAQPASAVTRSGAGKLQLQDAPSESQGKLRLTNGEYYGIELNAGRMLFVIDRSGSMREPAYHETRLQSAKRELIRALDQLSPDAEFAIMLFDTEIQSWRNKLTPATQENKLHAIEFVKGIEIGDRTNTHGVLTESLRFDDQLEAVFVLTDGRPTAGVTISPQVIIHDIVGRNHMRHLKFNTIGIGVNPTTSEFLKTLATETGGEYRRVD